LQIPQAGKKVKRFVPLVNQSRFETFKFLNMKKLERNEMKKLMGGLYAPGSGGTCAAKSPEGGTIHNLSMSEAQAYANQHHTNWCCSSCSTATWYCPTGEFCPD
jgi:hypothetical protein